MPIYEYRCQECKKRFERIVLSASAAADSAACPKCGAKKAERLVSRFATSAKTSGDDFGSGFGGDDFGGDDFGGGGGGGFGDSEAGGGGGEWGGDEDPGGGLGEGSEDYD